MTFPDSARPYKLFFDVALSRLWSNCPCVPCLVVSLPRPTAVELGADGPGGLACDFLLGTERLHRTTPALSWTVVT